MGSGGGGVWAQAAAVCGLWRRRRVGSGGGGVWAQAAVVWLKAQYGCLDVLSRAVLMMSRSRAGLKWWRESMRKLQSSPSQTLR